MKSLPLPGKRSRAGRRLHCMYMLQYGVDIDGGSSRPPVEVVVEVQQLLC